MGYTVAKEAGMSKADVQTHVPEDREVIAEGVTQQADERPQARQSAKSVRWAKPSIERLPIDDLMRSFAGRSGMGGCG